MLNNNYLTQPINAEIELGNGLSYKENRGKKEIIKAKVISVPDYSEIIVGDIIMYPIYAADNININAEAEVDDANYHVVKLDDIICKL